MWRGVAGVAIVVAMRIVGSILLAAFGAGCSAGVQGAESVPDVAATTDVNKERAPLVPFDPPTPLGCAGAAAYDGCFAFDHATPLAVTIVVPESTKKGALAVVRFHPVTGDATNTAKALVANQVEFRVPARAELHLYFQVFPGSYAIEAGVDSDDDGDAFGAHDASGWSSVAVESAVTDQSAAAIVEVADAAVSTSFSLALPQ